MWVFSLNCLEAVNALIMACAGWFLIESPRLQLSTLTIIPAFKLNFFLFI